MQSGASTGPVSGQFFIQGVTRDGRIFRPSDWAERLSGALSCFRQPGVRGLNDHLQYSPFVRPTWLDGVRSVFVDEALREVEPLAFEFVVNFAKDNDLKVIDACVAQHAGRQADAA